MPRLELIVSNKLSKNIFITYSKNYLYYQNKNHKFIERPDKST